MSSQIHLQSPDFADGGPIPPAFAKDVDGPSPALRWADVPEGTRELVLVVDDPDAPGATPWVHWIVTGIDPVVRELPRGASGIGTEWRNDFDETGWGGPQPPVGHGEHRYFFRLHAFAEPLGVTEADGVAALRARLAAATAVGEIMGRFERR